VVEDAVAGAPAANDLYCEQFPSDSRTDI
jgi:hypothetical protein